MLGRVAACLLIHWIVSAIASTTPVCAAEWQAGLAVVKITPEAALPMAGYASRNRPSEGVAGDLYAKVLALQDAGGQRAVWITTDLIGIRGTVAEQICLRIAERTGLKRDQILINSSHTHSGPAIADSDIAAYGISPASTARIAAYRTMLQDRIVQAVSQALARMEPAELATGAGVVSFAANRREFREDPHPGVNPHGPVDRTMPLLRVASPDGRARAVVFGAATHNTTLTGDEYRISGDYAGFAQDDVERHLPGVQAMFVLGFAGDSDPYPRGTLDLAREHGEMLGREVRRVLASPLRAVHGPLNVQFGYADIPLAPAPPRSEIQRMTDGGSPVWRAWMATRMLEALDRGQPLPTQYHAPIAVWQFGADLTLVALSGEVVVDYVSLIEKALGPAHLWLSAYNNDVFGYLPSARVLAEGGYETRGVVHGGPGFFSPGAQDVVVARVQELAGKAGRRE